MEIINNTESYGTYSLSGIKKQFFNFAQKLPKNVLGFKIGLVLRKLVLMNKLRIIDETQFDLKLRLYPLDNLGDRFLLFMPKYFEYDEFKMMSAYLKPNSVFIDIGGNMGIYSLIAAKNIDESGKILAFEPNPQMFERFKLNAIINDFDKVINIQQIGIADKNSEFKLGFGHGNLGGASIVNHNGEDSLIVKCRLLLDVLNEQNIEQIDLMKIDIEEAEPLALNPFFATAPQALFPKIIIIESPDKIDLRKLGYEPIFPQKTRAGNMIFKLKE